MDLRKNFFHDAVFFLVLFILIPPVTFSGQCFAQENENLDNDVIRTILERRSVRQYQDKVPARNILDVVARCGINAPSAMNMQPWQVRVVTSGAFIDGLTSIYLKGKKKPGNEFKNIFRNAPAVIFIASPKNGSGKADCGMLAENMLIAAQSLGLGTCVLGSPVQFMNTSPEARPYLDQLDLPADFELLLAIAIGYPAEKPAVKDRDGKKVKFID